MSAEVSAILLAAGSSTRMGQPKQLLPLKGKKVIDHCIDSLAAAGIRQIITVISVDNTGLGEALQSLPVAVVVNNKPGSDMAESVRTAISMVSPSATGVLVFPADHPLVAADTIRRMVAVHKELPGRILIPVYSKKRGHPALFPVAILQEIATAHTLRDIIGKSKDRVIFMDVTDEGVILDMDTEEDYLHIRRLAEYRPA